MEEAKRKERNAQRKSELYPKFEARLSRVIEEMEGAGFRPRIQDAWRSPADQLKAYNSGHSELRYGFHNVTAADGTKEALAVDLLDDDFPLEPRRAYVIRLAAIAEKHGLMTGIRFGLKTVKLRNAVDSAISGGDWNAPIKIGWDPTHVQSAELTVAQAEQGLRPA